MCMRKGTTAVQKGAMSLTQIIFFCCYVSLCPAQVMSDQASHSERMKRTRHRWEQRAACGQ